MPSLTDTLNQTLKQATGNFSDPLIAQYQNVMSIAQNKNAKQAQAQLQQSLDKMKNASTETACKAAAKLESELKDKVKEITLFPEKIPMNLTESVATKVNKIAPGVNQSEMTIEVQPDKFVKTAWLGRSIDAIGVEDPYGIKDSSVVNKGTDNDLTVAAVAIKKYILEQDTLKDDLPSLVKQDDGKINISPEGLANRIKTALGGSSTAMNLLGSTLMGGNLTGNLNNAVQGLMSKFNVSLGGQISEIVSQSPSNAQALLEGINRLTKQSNFAQLFDVGAQTQLLTGLLGEAVQLKLPGAVEVLADHAGSDNALSAALKNVFQSALNSGDLDTINAFTEHLSSNQIAAMAPNAAQTLLSSFKLPAGTSSSELASKATALLSTLNQLSPMWDQYQRGGASIGDLTALARISADALRTLSTQSSMKESLLIAEAYPPQGILESIQEKYPMCPVGLTA